jgi:hypothetical protein
MKLAEKVAALGGHPEVIDIGGDNDPGSIQKEYVQKIRKELDFQLDGVYLNTTEGY